MSITAKDIIIMGSTGLDHILENPLFNGLLLTASFGHMCVLLLLPIRASRLPTVLLGGLRRVGGVQRGGAKQRSKGLHVILPLQRACQSCSF